MTLLDETGGGTLVLAVENNQMNGPVTVEGGTVRPLARWAVPGGLVVAGGTFDGNGFDYSLPFLKGAGGAALNGRYRVSEAMGPTPTAATNGCYATVSEIAFGENCLVSAPARVVDEVLGVPYFRVLSACQGTVTLDFARTEDDPLPYDAVLKIAELSPEVASFPSIRAVNTGLPKAYTVTRVVMHDLPSGEASVYAVVKPAGTMIYVR